MDAVINRILPLTSTFLGFDWKALLLDISKSILNRSGNCMDAVINRILPLTSTVLDFDWKALLLDISKSILNRSGNCMDAVINRILPLKWGKGIHNSRCVLERNLEKFTIK